MFFGDDEVYWDIVFVARDLGDHLDFEGGGDERGGVGELL